MTMKPLSFPVLAVALLCAPLAHGARRHDAGSTADAPVYVGGGLNENSVSGWGNATGFQLFGGYDFGRITRRASTPLDLAVEVGYMNTGDFQRDVNGPFGPTVASQRYQGLWSTALFTLPLNEQVDLLGRLGLDLGDDSGVMGGIGVGVNVSRAAQVRFEYVTRPTVDSLQVNFAFYPGR